MRILLITPLYPGYINQSPIESTYVVHYLAREWIKKHDVQVVRIWPYYPKIFNWLKKARELNNYSYLESFDLNGVNVLRIPIMKFPKTPYLEKEVKRVAKQIVGKISGIGKPDIIICDTLDPSIFIGNIISKKYNSLLVASLHNTDIKYLSKRKNYEKFISIESDINKIVFRSPVVENKFLELYSGSKIRNDLFKIYFGIDKNIFITRDKLEHKIMNSKKEIIVAASLKGLKKVDILIKAFANMDNNEKYILRIIGDGPERKRLENLSKSLDCKDRVIFEGEKTREEVLNAMEGAEIFAMVSSPETFGLVYLEAMANGCITIGSKNEGIDGVIINNYNGFLCTPGNVKELKETLDKIALMSIDDKRKIIYRAVKTAFSFTNEKLAEEYLNKIKGNNNQ